MNASSFLLLRQPSLFSLALLRSLARERGKQLQELLSAAGAHGHPSGMRAGFCIAQPWEGFPGLWGGKLDPSVGMRALVSLRSVSQEGECAGGSGCSAPACS